MPVLPKEETEGMRTRSQRQQDLDQRRSGDAPSTSSGGQRDAAAAAEPAQSSASPNLAALMAFMQEQARRLEEQMQRDKEEQMQRDKEEEARRQEEQFMVIKDLRTAIGKEMKEVKDQVQQHETRIAEVEKSLRGLKSGDGSVVAAVVASSPRGFKVPPFNGSSSWSAYKIQFEAVIKSNGWTTKQAFTALTLGLRDQALTVLEALGQDVTYEKLLEALEARYGDAHLEHVFRAQLKATSD